MPSHRKTKRKKKLNKHGRSGNPYLPQETGTPSFRIIPPHYPQRETRQREPQQRLSTNQKKSSGQNFYAYNDLLGQSNYFFPDTSSPHNKTGQKYMKGDYGGIDSYDFVIDCMLNAHRLPDDILPPMQLQEAPGGYCLNP